MASKLATIFLLDPREPKHLLLLKRGPERKFAPNLYTGLGGKVEEGETPHAGAVRELKEESGLSGIDLTEFGKLVINDTWMIHQFVGSYQSDTVPDCSEGDLEWVLLDDVFTKDLIPTAKIFLEEWKKRNWDTRSFSVLVHRQVLEDVFSNINSIEVREGFA